jgi:hypothetical protein
MEYFSNNDELDVAFIVMVKYWIDANKLIFSLKQY